MSARTASLACAVLALVACDSSERSPTAGVDHGARDLPSPTPAQAQASPPSRPTSATAARDGIRWTQAPGGLIDASPLIHDAIAKERADGRTLLVYVGATWCEPCQRFHHAVEKGELDAAFPRLSVLAFDADRDSEALASAGYFSRLIPLFAIPKEDGCSSGKQIEGSVKGADAVGEIAPRLRALVAGGS